MKNAYGDRYDIFRMYDSKRSVANLLGEGAEERFLTARLQAKQGEQKEQKPRITKRREQER